MEKRVIEPFNTTTMRLVKSEDLNHHGTLFAGRTAEWFVESGFIAATSILDPKNVVCLKIHGMYFSKPVRPGQIICLTSKVVYAGRTSMIANIKVTVKDQEKPIVNGFITFVHVDENTKPSAHMVEILAVTDEDKILYETARGLRHK